MPFRREITRLIFAFLFLFAIVTLAAGYWAVQGADTVLLRFDNPRLFDAQSRIQRGAIFDRRGEILARSDAEPDGTMTRTYPNVAAASITGYYSLIHGEGGAEAAYNALLNGANMEETFSTQVLDDLLHRPQRGSDVRLALDSTLQNALTEAMGGRRGAAVVVRVPDGNILALVSLPSYDPNTLDGEWDALQADAQTPLANRALEGIYQPGSALQTPLLATALTMQIPLDSEIDAATETVNLEAQTLSCAVPLPPTALNLRDAYAFACPSPFEHWVIGGDAIFDAAALRETFGTFRLDQRPTLPGYETLFGAESTAVPSPFYMTDDILRANALGQGTLTVNPLQMAMIAAAIVNDGNAPQPYLLESTRAPQGEWISAHPVLPTLPMMTTNTARQMQDLMRNAVANGAAQNAGRPNIDIGGHVGIAYAGETSQTWFVGFATLGGLDGLAVAVVLEDNADPGLAADIGGTALLTAQASLLLPAATP